jgi:ATP-dependent Zn protease
MNLLVRILLNWFPMFFLIGVWVFFMFRMRKGPLWQFQRDGLDVQRRQAEALERIAVALEKRS